MHLFTHPVSRLQRPRQASALCGWATESHSDQSQHRGNNANAFTDGTPATTDLTSLVLIRRNCLRYCVVLLPRRIFTSTSPRGLPVPSSAFSHLTPIPHHHETSELPILLHAELVEQNLPRATVDWRPMTTAMEATSNNGSGEAPPPAASDSSARSQEQSESQKHDQPQNQNQNQETPAEQPQKQNPVQNPTAQPSQAQPAPAPANQAPQRRQIAPRDRYYHQSLGISLNSSVKQVR